MFKIQTLNQIALKGLDCFSREKYEISSDHADPDAILVRSQKLSIETHESLKAVARAGAGVNNIPVTEYTQKGIVVFNTPGANANAVKELVLTGLLLSSRGIYQGIQYVQDLDELADKDSLNKEVEAAKKAFKGQELSGKTLGIVGLGAIGSMVAKMALDLGMRVVGYDPAISVDAAWRLPSTVERMENLLSLVTRSDYVSLHVPALASTENLINETILQAFKPNSVLLNFARDTIVDHQALQQALETKRVRTYVTDFPRPEFLHNPSVLAMPHLGASTAEAEENCAVMAAEQLIDFLENGNIVNSVNFPTLALERTNGYRIALVNLNVPRMLSHVLEILAERNLNVIDMLNKSRDQIAYNLIDVDTAPTPDLLRTIRGVQGVINVRQI